MKNEHIHSEKKDDGEKVSLVGKDTIISIAIILGVAVLLLLAIRFLIL